VRVRSPQGDTLRDVLSGAGASVALEPDGAMVVAGLDAPAIGDMAARLGLALHELAPQSASLEQAYMELTHDSVEFRAEPGVSSSPPSSPPSPPPPATGGATEQ